MFRKKSELEARATADRAAPPRLVLDSIENDQHDRCVDLFSRPDGSHGFAEFRRDVEDGGAWTQILSDAGMGYPTAAAALDAARQSVRWLGAALARTTLRDRRAR